MNPVSETQAQPLPRVLIIDDSRMVRASIIKQIRASFDIREEADGEAGWQTLLLDPTIEVVISDIGMPRLDGYGLLERIRGSKIARVLDLPVIIISGEDENEARERAKSAGATDFITKGTPTVELLARLDALVKLAQTRRELERSREQLVRNYHGDVSVMAIEIDRFEELANRYGRHVAQLVHRKMSKLLSAKVRKEDTVAHLAEGQFAIISPSADLDACGAFALRLRRAIEAIVMTYKEERIRISLTVGIASAGGDAHMSLEELIAIAVARVQDGKAQGGNIVVTDSGEVTPENVGRFSRLAVSVDHALTQLRTGQADEVRRRMREVVATMMPLLEFIDAEYQLGMPLTLMAEKANVVNIERTEIGTPLHQHLS